MAIAINAPVVRETSTELRAAMWTTISAGIALVVTIPLVVMLALPISELMFVRGSQYHNDWGRAFTATFVILAPAIYTLFMGTATELLQSRVPAVVHRNTVRVAAIGMVPYIVMITIGTVWVSGPQESFMVASVLTLVVGILSTIWASTQNH